MKILFDLIATQPIGLDKFHGAGEYAKIVFYNLLKYKKDSEIVAFYNKNRPINIEILKLAQSNNVELIPIISKNEIQSIIYNKNINKIFSALPYDYIDIDFFNKECIFIVHGLRNIEMPTDYYEYIYLSNIIEKARYVKNKKIFYNKYKEKMYNNFKKLITLSNNSIIITPSLHTKYSIINIFPEINKEQIYVLYSPRHRYVFPSNERTLKKYNIIDKEYFLLISSNRWIKNAYRAILAFDQLFSDFPLLNKKVLVLGSENGKKFKGLINKNRFIYIDYVERSDLELFYKSAYCFVYPSLNEGFGYPPLECMKYGTPVISSAIASLTEILQDGVMYFNPFSIDEIKNRILQILLEPGLYDKYSQKGVDISRKISLKQDKMLDKLNDIILSKK